MHDRLKQRPVREVLFDPRCVAFVLLVSVVSSVGGSPRKTSTEIILAACPTAREIRYLDPLEVPSFKGLVRVQEAAGDVFPLPETLVHLTKLGDEEPSPTYSTRSRKDRLFSLENVPEGRYQLTVCKEGFVTLAGTVVLSRQAAPNSVVLVTRLDW